MYFLIIWSKFVPKSIHQIARYNIHQIARYHFPNYKIFQDLRGTHPPQIPPCAGSWCWRATKLSPTNVEDGSTPLITVYRLVGLSWLLAPSPICKTWLHYCIMPMCVRYRKVDIKMIIFCMTICPCFFSSFFQVKVDLLTSIIETTSSNKNNLIISFLQTSPLILFTGGQKSLGNIGREGQKSFTYNERGVKKVLIYQNWNFPVSPHQSIYEWSLIL